MRIRSMLVLAIGGLSACWMPLAATARETLPTPISLEVILSGEKNQRVAGKLVAFDEAGLTLNIGSEGRILKWDELVPSSAFGVKFRLINRDDASQWLELGRWGWSRGLVQQARSALGNARRLDPALASQIDAVLAEPAGSALSSASSNEPTTRPTVPGGTAPESASDEPAAQETTAMQPGYRAGQVLIRYATPTAQENAAQIERTRKRAAEAERVLEATFVEIETDHFLIFTDWEAREHGFLKEQCEAAYAVLARQFNQPVKESVFVGKLPIFMFATQKEFLRFAREFDEFGAGETVLGYFHSSPIEQGHMAMWKPGVGSGIGAGGSPQLAMRNWGRTLVHEFTHAFIHRYKSNARIPRWLNEGVAEMISEATLPSNNYRSQARSAAQDGVDVMPLFDDSNIPSGYYYPVMMTLAECLQKQSSKRFLSLFDEIKDGTEPEAALQKVYGINYLKLAEGWSRYAKGLK
jgi:hypothetical protein